MRVGEIVKECRQTKGMTQKQLSEMSGVARQTVADVECGRHGTSVAILTELLDAMGYELAVVKKDDGQQTQRSIKAVISKAL